MALNTDNNPDLDQLRWLRGQLVILAVLIGVTTFVSWLCWYCLPNVLSQGLFGVLAIPIFMMSLIGYTVWVTGMCIYDIYVGIRRGGTDEKAQKWDY